MRRITTSLPDDVARAAEREARRRRVSLAEIVRIAVVDHLGLDRPRVLPFAAIFESEHTDTSEHAEEILAAEWSRHSDR